MSRLRVLFFAFIMVLTFTNINAQYHFRTINVKSGLQHNYVNDILRDHDGFMWLGSLNGLSRYDGYRYRSYNIINRKGLTDNNVCTLQESRDGTIWIKTYNGGLFYYDPSDDKIHFDFQSKLSTLGIHTTHVPQIFTDQEMNLWCADGHHLYYYSYSRKELHQAKVSRTPIQIVGKGKLSFLLFPDGSLAQIDFHHQRLKFITKVHIPNATDLTMTLDLEQRVWIYDKYKCGLLCINGVNGKKINFDAASFLNNDIVKSVKMDCLGYVWIGTNSNGLYVVQNRTGTIIHLTHAEDNEFSVASNHVNCIYCDNNTVWIGTKSGVSYTSLNGLNVSTIRTPRDEDISCFAQDEQGNLYLGYDGKGFDIFNSAGVNIRHFDTTNSLLLSNLVIGMNKDVDGSILLGTYGSGFYRFKAGKLSALSHVNGELTLFARHAFRDKMGNLWIGTMNSGLIKIDREGRYTHYTYKNSVLRTNAITQMSYSPISDKLYLSTSTGVYYVDGRGKLHCTDDRQSGLNSLQDIQTTTMYVDERGLLWIGTIHGLRIYDTKYELLSSLDRRDNLSNLYIQAITGDKLGNIWVTTENGLTHILVKHSQNGRFSFVCFPYYRNDGLGDINFVSNSLFCRTNGDILAGGFGKYLVVDPSQTTSMSRNGHVRFTELYIANEKVDAGKKNTDGRFVLSRDISHIDSFTLNYGDNFSLDVSSLNYSCLDNTQYAYRLSDKDEWTIISGNRINLSHLSSGKYELEVKITNVFDQDSTISRIKIHILPPFWLSFWAFAVYLLLFLSVFLFIWHYIVHKHRLLMMQHQREMEDLQRKRTDELKMQFVTNISHDLRTPLSLIITPIEQFVNSGRHSDIQDTLQMILRNAKSLLEMVNQLLEVRNIADKKELLKFTYSDIAAFVIKTSEPYKSVACRNNLTFNINYEVPQIYMDFDEEKVRRVIINLISNAIKYNLPGGSISVDVKKKENNVVLSVSDTGIGIKEINKDMVFQRFFQEHHTEKASRTGNGIGLFIVKEYVDMMNGHVLIQDNTPNGSIFKICLPIPYHKSETTQVYPITISGEKTLLIVEDNDDFRNFITDCLKDEFQIIQAVNGKDALEKLGKTDVNMIISDVMMPLMDGMELCRRVKTDVNFSHVPVILLTARATDEHVIAGLKEGADDYITKPFNVEIFKMRIHKIFDWLKQAQMRLNQPDVEISELIISDVDERLINKATKLVEDNLDDNDFSVEKFSESMNMSRSALYKKMMAVTGRAPLEFMRVIRLRHGLKIIKEGNMNVSEVAYSVGLSPKQFSKFFKEEYGCLPSEYINQHFRLTRRTNDDQPCV